MSKTMSWVGAPSESAAPATQAEPSVPRRIAPVIAFVLLAFVVYAPCLGAGFIWDDGRAITDNANFKIAGGFGQIWAGRGEVDYLPLKSSILWLIYQCFGPATAPYHVFNVAVHSINAVLIWRVLRRLRIPGAWLAGLIFLVHPTHVESVAWVSECKNTLSTLFGLLSLVAWLAFLRDRRPGRYLAALGLFACGLLCKPHVVILPAVMLLCLWWQAGQESVRRSWWRTVPFFVLALSSAAITLGFQNSRAIAGYRLPVGGVASRVANAGKATWWYLGKAISPVHPWLEMPDRPIETMSEAQAVLAGTRSANPAPSWPQPKLTAWPLSMIYRQWRVTPPAWYDFLPGLAMAALFVWLVRLRKGWGRGAFFAACYFLLALSPVLGLVPMSYMRAAWVADHFQYLADIGVIALGCGAGVRLWERLSGSRRWLLAGAAAVVVAGYATASFARACDYRSEYAMWSDTVAKNPYASQAQIRLGVAMLARREVQGAVWHLSEGGRLDPENPDGQNNLGLALIMHGRASEGIEHLKASLRLDDRQFFAHANLADVLASQRQYADAVLEYRAAIRSNPRLAPLRFRLATALLDMGQVEEAIAEFERTQALAPNNQEVARALAKARESLAPRMP